MSEDKPIDVGRSLANVWSKLLMEKQYDASLMAAVLGYLIAVDTQDSDFKAGATSWIEKTMQERLAAEKDSKEQVEVAHSCSFCGRGEPDVRLAAGAKGFICNECVAKLSTVFSDS